MKVDTRRSLFIEDDNESKVVRKIHRGLIIIVAAPRRCSFEKAHPERFMDHFETKARRNMHFGYLSGRFVIVVPKRR